LTGRRVIRASLALLCSSGALLAEPPAPPQIVAVGADSVEVADQGRPVRLQVGDRLGSWSFMAVTTNASGKPLAVFEDFTTMGGGIVVADGQGNRQEFPKSLEPTFADPKTLYRGHTFQEVVGSDHDLLGAEILGQAGDPGFAAVATCFAPIARMGTYTFVGTRESSDKIGVAYGGRTGNFDPAVYVPAIERIRAEGRVLDGLVGGWLPAVRFVYPERAGDWSELVLYAPLRQDDGNSRIQPVWYRVCRVEGNALKWAKYADSYLPVPPRTPPPPGRFYQDLLGLRDGWEKALAPAMQVRLPDERLANLARHSLVRALITRIGAFPKYGVMDRNYGGAEHDGFQDTFNVETTAMLEWGLFERARSNLDNYFTSFVRDDGSILYRGPETGQYGRMLTVVAEYFNDTGDGELLLKHRARIDAVTRLLLQLRREAQLRPRENTAYGMISGWCEADSCLEPEPARYLQPYLSNSSEAVRGFGDLGAAWERIGQREQRADLSTWGSTLRREARELDADLQTAIGRSLLTRTDPVCLPAIAGAAEPFDVAVPKDIHDPQFRAYRAYMELLFSGCLTRAEVDTIVRYREAHRDLLLGVPAAYGYSSREMGGFLSYGHAYGLLQHDFVRAFLLELYSLAAHQYTRGTWTAPETRRLDPGEWAAPYCVPAQLSVPLLVRWLLAFEDPQADTLWLCKGAPRDWFREGSTVAASGIPTRWGKVSFQITSHLDARRMEATIELPASAAPGKTKLRLRVPEQRPIASVLLGGRPWEDFDPETETISLPASVAGMVELTVGYR
jgi:hypothetical protein